jgi:alkylation response protein AidB-like acyl-CoA dehydrogenase
MDAPGIEVRPIRTMDGGAHFAEVFYDEVAIPVGNVVGGLHQGWRTAMTTFSFERGSLYLDSQLRLPYRVTRLAAEALETGRGSRYEIARVRAMTSAVRALSYRLISEAARQRPPGPAASLSKVATSDALQAVAELGMAVRGPGTLSLDDEMTHEGLYEYAWLLAGGTPEIHRNVIAERVLGLPR